MRRATRLVAGMLARAAGYWRDREPPRAGRGTVSSKAEAGTARGGRLRAGAARTPGVPLERMHPLDSPGRDPCTVRSSVVGSATAAGHGVTEP